MTDNPNNDPKVVREGELIHLRLNCCFCGSPSGAGLIIEAGKSIKHYGGKRKTLCAGCSNSGTCSVNIISEEYEI